MPLTLLPDRHADWQFSMTLHVTSTKSMALRRVQLPTQTVFMTFFLLRNLPHTLCLKHQSRTCFHSQTHNMSIDVHV